MGIHLPDDWEPPPGGMFIYPMQLAPFIRRPAEYDSGDEGVPAMELVDGHFGLLRGFAVEVKYDLPTYNARSETVATLACFKSAWAGPRRCLIPCQAKYEPDWRTGKATPTRFTAANDDALGLAGLSSPWKNVETGAWEVSFTLLTINADTRLLFMHMHRPDLKRPVEKQDKRMVVILPAATSSPLSPMRNGSRTSRLSRSRLARRTSRPSSTASMEWSSAGPLGPARTPVWSTRCWMQPSTLWLKLLTGQWFTLIGAATAGHV